MSEKISLVRAAAKLKRAKKNRSEQSENDGNTKARRGRDREEEESGGLFDSIINAVHSLKRDD